jgi:hypothetical protein
MLTYADVCCADGSKPTAAVACSRLNFLIHKYKKMKNTGKRRPKPRAERQTYIYICINMYIYLKNKNKKIQAKDAHSRGQIKGGVVFFDRCVGGWVGGWAYVCVCKRERESVCL